MNSNMCLYWKIFQQGMLFTIIAVTSAEPSKYDMVRYLLQDSGYDHGFPPDTENVTDVSVQLHITDIDSESDKNMEIELILNLRMNWTDGRLDFSKNETSYEVINLGDNFVDNLWIPDLYFIHERKSELHGLFRKNQLVYIHKNGHVFYSGRFNIKTQCDMTFNKYPYDIQFCPIEIQSYAFTTDYLLLRWNGEDAVQIDSNILILDPKNPQQEHRNETRYTYTDIGEFSTLTTKIRVKRPEGSYVITIIVPPIIVVTITLMTFLLDKNVIPRITIPTGGLTQLFVQWAGIYNMLSLDSTPQYLDAWMFGNILCVAIILFLNIVICHYKYIGNDENRPQNERSIQELANKLYVYWSKCKTHATISSEHIELSESSPILPSTNECNTADGESKEETRCLIKHMNIVSIIGIFVLYVGISCYYIIDWQHQDDVQ